MTDERDRKPDPDNHAKDPKAKVDPEEAARRGRFSRLGEQLTGLLDPEGAFRRGQDIVTGVTQATKDEVIRIIGAEVRNFLDKMDAAELMQEVIAGLVVDVNMQIKFSRDERGGAPQPKVTKSSSRIRNDARRDAKPRDDDDADDDDAAR